MPAISIAIPSLKKDKILSFSPDSNQIVNVVAFAGAFEDEIMDGKHQFVVMTSDVAPAQAGDQFFQSLLLPTAQAAVSAKIPSESICQHANVSCCPIVEAGDTVCPHPLADSTPSQLYLAIMDQDGTLSKTSPEMIQENILWLRNTPKDVASIIPSPLEGEGQGEGAHSLYALTKNIGVQIISSDDGLHVLGSHENSYESFISPNAEQLAYEPISKILATKRPALDILLNPNGFIPPGGAALPEQSITVPEAKYYTVLKTATNGKMYFGIETKNESEFEKYKYQGRIRYATDPASPETIVFLDEGNKNKDFNQITHSKTLVFDVDANGWALVVFEDTLGQMRLRMGKNKGLPPLRIGGEQPLSGIFDFKELQIYQADITGDSQGRALILDSFGSRIGMIIFNYKLGGNKQIVLNDWIKLGDNKSPQSFALNPDKTKAFIANKADDTLSILTLKENGVLKTPIEIQQGIQTVQLADFIKDKKIPIQPNKVLYQQSPAGDYLVVSSEGLRGAMIVPIQNLESLGTQK